MALDAFVQRQSEPESVGIKVRLLGTGAAAPTKVLGQGITVTYTGVGIYKLTFAELPGTFEKAGGVALQAVTPGDIKGHTVVFDTWDATTKSIEVTFWNASEAAHDLAANEWLSFTLFFKRTGV
jgi:hypothetical protein